MILVCERLAEKHGSFVKKNRGFLFFLTKKATEKNGFAE